MPKAISVIEINNFLNTTHTKNLERLRARLAKGEWHWMLPDNWENTKNNRNILFNSINAKLLPRPTFIGGRR